MDQLAAARESQVLGRIAHRTGNDVQFQRLLEKLPAGAYMCDPEGLITYFNPRAADLWGRAPRLNEPEDRY